MKTRWTIEQGDTLEIVNDKGEHVATFHEAPIAGRGCDASPARSRARRKATASQELAAKAPELLEWAHLHAGQLEEWAARMTNLGDAEDGARYKADAVQLRRLLSSIPTHNLDIEI